MAAGTYVMSFPFIPFEIMTSRSNIWLDTSIAIVIIAFLMIKVVQKMRFKINIDILDKSSRNGCKPTALSPSQHKSSLCAVGIHRQMSSLGRFCLRSQTSMNPSIMTFFALLVHENGKDVEIDDFQQLWRRKVLDRYERFNARICQSNDSFFEIHDDPIEKYTMKVDHPNGERNELYQRIESMLLSPLDVREKLWEVKISSGNVGSSGAISQSTIDNLHNRTLMKRETLALFRVHHSVCDGVSMSAVLGEVSDEADNLREMIEAELEHRRKEFGQLRFLEKIFYVIHFFLFYTIGTAWALLLQGWRMMSSKNPFDPVLQTSLLPPGRRSICWREIGSLEEMKKLTKAITPAATLNDLAVSLVTTAIRMQLEEHQRNQEITSCSSAIIIPESVNVVIPVHLHGGVILPGQDIGNKIGAFVTNVPISNGKSLNASRKVKITSEKLMEGKRTPAPYIAWRLAKFFSDYTPETFAKLAMRKANAEAVAVISNIKGFPSVVHWFNRPVEKLCAFLPLPPGVPIGIMIMSYAGKVSFSVNADMRVVPDAEKFADWMIEEYELLKKVM